MAGSEDGARHQWISDHPVNTLGATIFWLYILFALIFTASIWQSLYAARSAPRVANRRRADILFTALAIISFVSLSFHMLHFLIWSYRDWRHVRRQQGIDLNQEKFTIGSFVYSILEWSQTSTLFQDFGTEIARTKARFTWTLAALWMTFLVVFDLGKQVAMGRLPRFWAFCGLSQILPISFTQNLLYVSQLRGSTTPSPTWNREVFESGILATAVIYAICPFMVTDSIDSSTLMRLIVFIRSLLFVPPILALILGRRKPTHRQNANARQPVKLIVTGLGVTCSVVHLYLTLLEFSSSDLQQALFANPAVSALGFDFVISAFSALCWHVFGLKDQ